MKWLCISVLCILSLSGYAQVSLTDSIRAISFYTNQAELGEIFRRSGITFKNKGDYSRAKECYSTALDIYTELDHSVGMASVLNNLGLLSHIQSDNTLALQYYYKSVELNESIDNDNGLVKNYLNLGNFFFRQNDFRQALEYYYRCREKLKLKDNEHIRASIHLGIGNILSNSDYPHLDLDKAQEECLSALVIYQRLNNYSSISRVYNNLGVISFNQLRYDEAIKYYTKGLETKIKLNDQKGALISYHNIGSVLQKKEDYEQSLEYYKKGKRIAEELGDAENYLHIISNIVNVYMELGKADSAAVLFEEYNLLRDSVYNEEKSRQLTELQTQYETEKTTRELTQQKAATQEKVIQNRILTIAVISLGLLAIAVVVLFLQRQKAVKHLHDKEDELHKQEMSRLQKEQDIQSLRSMMDGQQQERKRIAEDLHDRLGAKLSAIKLFHESSQTDMNKFDKVDEMLNETIIETREIAHNLAPSALTKYGLVQALQDLLDALQSTNKIETQFSYTNLQERLPEGVETALYYIVQELVTNTLRHSEAGLLSINLVCHENGLLNLCYEDNGKGFDPASLPKDSMGLRNMRTRLAPFDGSLSIDAMPGHGVTFIIDIALDTAKSTLDLS